MKRVLVSVKSVQRDMDGKDTVVETDFQVHHMKR